MNNTKNYTDAFNELKSIVSDLESDKISIDDMTEKIKQAGTLIDICKEKLKETELNVQEIIKKLDENNS